jgi:hypothetical protein
MGPPDESMFQAKEPTMPLDPMDMSLPAEGFSFIASKRLAKAKEQAG